MQFKQYPSYKNSGVEWLGDVPEHWYIFKSNKIFKQSNVRSYESDEQLTASQKYGVIPQSLYMKKEESKVVLALSGIDNFKHVDKNDFVISLRSFQGGIELCFYDGCVSPAYTVLKPNKVINYSFWSYLFKSTIYISVLNTAVDGIREGKTISYTNFGKIYINIPPLSEQAQIANYLDTETARIDNLINKQQKLIELLEEQRKSIISHAVTKGLNPNAPMKDSGVEWLGQVPEHWNISKLKYYLDGIKDGTHGTHVSTTEGELLLSGKNIKNGKLVINDNERKISLEDHQKITANGFPKKGDLLINVVGTIGQSCIYELDTPISFQRSVCFLRANNKLEPNFLQRILESNLSQNQLKILTNKSTIGGVYMGDLVELIIPVVPIKEQNKITDYLDKEIQEIVNCIDKQKLLIEKLKEYRASVISHAVTGKIDIRELVA